MLIKSSLYRTHTHTQNCSKASWNTFWSQMHSFKMCCFNLNLQKKPNSCGWCNGAVWFLTVITGFFSPNINSFYNRMDRCWSAKCSWYPAATCPGGRSTKQKLIYNLSQMVTHILPAWNLGSTAWKSISIPCTLAAAAVLPSSQQ